MPEIHDAQCGGAIDLLEQIDSLDHIARRCLERAAERGGRDRSKCQIDDLWSAIVEREHLGPCITEDAVWRS